MIFKVLPSVKYNLKIKMSAFTRKGEIHTSKMRLLSSDFWVSSIFNIINVSSIINITKLFTCHDRVNKRKWKTLQATIYQFIQAINYWYSDNVLLI